MLLASHFPHHFMDPLCGSIHIFRHYKYLDFDYTLIHFRTYVFKMAKAHYKSYMILSGSIVYKFGHLCWICFEEPVDI